MALTPPLILPWKLVVHTSARGPAGYYNLRRDAIEWLILNDIAYALRASPHAMEPIIFFEKSEDAFAFKMRWF